MILRSQLPLRNSVARTESPPEAPTIPSSQPSRSASATSEGSQDGGDHQPRETSGNPRSWRWSEDQELYLLESLLEARRQGMLRVKKEASYKALLDEVIPNFQKQWPDVYWGKKMMLTKLERIKTYWRAFKDVESYSGTSYRHETGLFEMSEADEDLCHRRYTHMGDKIITEGLLISDTINFEEYDEIFSDDKPAGRQVHPPGDRAYWRIARGRPRRIETMEEAAASQDVIEEEVANEAEDEERGAARDDPILVDSSQDTQDSQQSLPTSRDQSREAGNSPSRRSVVSSPPQPRRRTPARSSSRPRSELSPNNPSVDRRKKRKREDREDHGGMPWGEMKEVLMHQETRRTHNVISCARPVGSQDIEKAIANCEEVMKDAELSLMIRVICWFQEDPGNAVVWNALGSVAAKEAWIERKIGPAAEPRE
ncbi:hypothetical protein NCS52_00537400 [Fusarium sp. LHS14.1]|nr:hypothetical protein NCS52_00537400 [Fusarium sp. LHS14.1]